MALKQMKEKPAIKMQKNIRLFNTINDRVESLQPKNGIVRMYFCGPTVYDYAHIGNFRSYLFADLLRRYLKRSGFDVKMVMNITDVDDKTIRNARAAKVPLKQFTEQYAEAFFSDLDTLRIKPADICPKATEHIDGMISLIKKLMIKGIAYRTKDGIYFSINKFAGYGRLSGLERKSLKIAERTKKDEYDKEHVQDFALWKFWDEEDGDVFWETELGRGRPGWHIECSAMATKYLGDSIDIHGGGVDLIFPHHENEIAQSEAATGLPFVRHWVHCEHLLSEGRKMSKSLGNYHTLRDLVDGGNSAIGFRYLCLSAHYRSKLNFTFASLETAERTVESINGFYRRLKDELKSRAKADEDLMDLINEARAQFFEHLDNDLNTPMALAVFFELMKTMNRQMDEGKADKAAIKKVIEFMEEFNEIFDIFGTEEELNDYDKKLIADREEARRKKDFAKADHIRDILKKRGVLLEDTPSGIRWKVKRQK